MEKEIYKIIIGLAGFLVLGGGWLGFLIIRLVRNYDSQIKELFNITKDIPAIKTDIVWLKDGIKK